MLNIKLAMLRVVESITLVLVRNHLKIDLDDDGLISGYPRACPEEPVVFSDVGSPIMRVPHSSLPLA